MMPHDTCSTSDADRGGVPSSRSVSEFAIPPSSSRTDGRRTLWYRMGSLLVALGACGGDVEPAPAPATPAADSNPAVDPKAAAESKTAGDLPTKPPAESEAPPSCARCEAGSCRPADAKACDDEALKHRHGRDGRAFDLAEYGRLTELACNAGRGSACSSVAMLYQDGLGGRPHDDAKAAQLHQKGCELGAGIGCFNLAMMIESGGHGVADPKRAAPWYAKAHEQFREACDRGEHQWCANLGYMLESGMGVPKDEAKAIAAYEEGCPGHPDNCTNLALMILDGRGGAADPAKARTLLEDTCSEGKDGWSCGFLGMSLLSGRGMAPEPQEAVRLLTLACEDQQKHACGGLAAAHGLGLGVERDVDRALGFNERACGLGDSVACEGAAKELMARNQAEDIPKLRQMLSAGCKIGDGRQCGALAYLHAVGRGGDKDEARAVELWSEGCRRGDANCCVALIERGDPIDVLPERASAMYQQACTSGIASACAGPP